MTDRIPGPAGEPPALRLPADPLGKDRDQAQAGLAGVDPGDGPAADRRLDASADAGDPADAAEAADDSEAAGDSADRESGGAEAGQSAFLGSSDVTDPALAPATDPWRDSHGAVATRPSLYTDLHEAAGDGEDGYAPPTDWAWVEEWRDAGEPVPWGPGLAVAGFTTVLVALAVYVLSAGLADQPLVDIGVNVLVAGGLAPALWLSRSLPVLRWIAGGAVVGVLGGWFALFVFLG